MNISVNKLIENLMNEFRDVLRPSLYVKYPKMIVQIIGVRFLICYMIINTAFFIVIITLLKL